MLNEADSSSRVTTARAFAASGFDRWDRSHLPQICHGKPVIRGLRYPVESMLEYLAAGDSFEDVLAEFPELEREDLLACLEFAKRSLQLKSQHLVLA